MVFCVYRNCRGREVKSYVYRPHELDQCIIFSDEEEFMRQNLLRTLTPTRELEELPHIEEELGHETMAMQDVPQFFGIEGSSLAQSGGNDPGLIKL